MKKLYRSSSDRRVTGVCGGLAEYFGIDSTILRVIAAIAFFSFGVGFWPYLILSILLPYDYAVKETYNRCQKPYETYRNSTYFGSRENSNTVSRKDVTPKEDWSDF